MRDAAACGQVDRVVDVARARCCTGAAAGTDAGPGTGQRGRERVGDRRARRVARPRVAARDRVGHRAARNRRRGAGWFGDTHDSVGMVWRDGLGTPTIRRAGWFGGWFGDTHDSARWMVWGMVWGHRMVWGHPRFGALDGLGRDCLGTPTIWRALFGAAIRGRRFGDGDSGTAIRGHPPSAHRDSGVRFAPNLGHPKFGRARKCGSLWVSLNHAQIILLGVPQIMRVVAVNSGCPRMGSQSWG
jgi:hypothetical protein